MKKILLLTLIILFAACSSEKTGNKASEAALLIDEATIRAITDNIETSQPSADQELLEKGVRHAASLWRAGDGSPSEFSDFVSEYFIADPAERRIVFSKISNYMESISGNFSEITLDLKKVLDETGNEIDEIDRMFGNYSIGSHLSDDLYGNKIAFVIALNFPYYTLAEKEKLGPSWSREEWAMARLGDYFVSRVPAELNQELGEALGNCDMYIAEYNIHMGRLRTDDGRQIFPDDMVLLSHWNLRDELKANYADKEKGPEKQEMIVKVMERIIDQTIPKVVINDPDHDWAPFANKVTRDGAAADAAPEPDTRYQMIINSFRAMKDIDAYNPEMNTAFTEAMAYVFQSRDLMLLGMKENNPDKEKTEILDAAWSLMEIMGVGMVEMQNWKWLYDNPVATAAQYKQAVMKNAIDTWNKYFAPVIGVKDSPLLAIYSHTVNDPLYLPNYSYGHVIQFQIEEYLKGKNLTVELDRIFKQGRLTPRQWMTGAVGSKISTQPLLEALEKVL